MKKILFSLAIAMVMAFSFTGCNWHTQKVEIQEEQTEFVESTDTMVEDTLVEETVAEFDSITE